MPTRRGTSNGNASGSSEDRRRRRAWLVHTYRADIDLTRVTWHNGVVSFHECEPFWSTATTEVVRVPACRCYRCGLLLVNELGPDGLPMPITVTVDRIIPGCQGGTYRRNNIRPACPACNSSTGGATRRSKS